MNTVNLHRIRKLHWRVPAASTSLAIRLRHSLRENWQPHLLPIFDEVFNEVTDGHQTLHIKSMNIRIELDADTDMEKWIQQQFTSQLRDQIKQQLSQIADESWESEDTPAFALTTQDSLTEFLRTGKVHWIHRNIGLSELKKTWQEYLLNEQCSGFLECLIKADSLVFIQRLVSLLSVSTLKTVLDKLLSTTTHRVWQFRYQVAIHWLAFAELNLNDWENLQGLSNLVWVLLDDQGDSAHVIDDILNPRFAHLFHQSLSLAMGATDVDATNVDEVVREFFSVPMRVASSTTSNSANQNSHSRRQLTLPVDIKLDLNERHDQITEQRSIESEKNSQDSSVYPLKISNAGAIILHPHIRQLFKVCGLPVVRNEKTSLFDQSRAVAILHYAIHGTLPEVDIGLELLKILCGVELSSSLIFAPELLAESDVEEITSLLNAVITQWSALKNTSADGLRISFLQREGLLSQVAEGWSLRIARDSIDILLDRLPWSISLIKSPLMEKPIYVEWRQ